MARKRNVLLNNSILGFLIAVSMALLSIFVHTSSLAASLSTPKTGSADFQGDTLTITGEVDAWTIYTTGAQAHADSLKKVVFNAAQQDVVVSGSNWCDDSAFGLFKGAKNLTTVTINGPVRFTSDTKEEGASCSMMFDGCTSLQAVNLELFDFSTVQHMYRMFADCSALTDVSLVSSDTYLLDDIEAMFSGCTSLETLDLSHFETANINNMKSCFASCTALQSLDLRYFYTINVKSMTKMFENCTSLSSWIVPSDFRFVGTDTKFPFTAANPAWCAQPAGADTPHDMTVMGNETTWNEYLQTCGSNVIVYFYRPATVIFDAGEGQWLEDGTVVKQKTMLGKPGSVLTLPSNPSLEGKVFASWNPQPGDTFPQTLTPVTITAQYGQGYTATFDPQDGQWEDGSKTPYVTDLCASGALVPAPTMNLESGDTSKALDYWKEQTTGERYKEGQTVFGTKNLVFVPVWKEGTLVTYTFSAGKGSFTDGSKTKQLQGFEGRTIDLSSLQLSYESFKFYGWMDDNGDYLPKNPTFGADPLTLTAQWATTITFYANGTTRFTDGQFSHTLELNIDDPFDVDVAGQFETSVYNFGGWGDSTDSLIPAQLPQTYETALPAYYAIWNKEIVFYSNGGAFTDHKSYIVSSKNVLEDFSWPDSEDLSWGDYELAGWSTSETGEVPVPKPATCASAASAYFAIWKRTVTFDANGGEFDGTVEVETVQAALVKLFSWQDVSTPTREGYKWVGWGLTADATTPAVAPYTYADAAPEYYAIWKSVVPPAPDETTYTFDAAQGYWGSSIRIQTVAGEPGTPVIAPKDPTCDGYEFDKWETADGMEYKEGYTMFGKDPLTFYAKYKEPAPTTTVYTFDAAQGSWSMGIRTMTVEGNPGEVVIAPTAPIYEGYEFDKWETADGLEYKEGYTMFGKDPLTFYARYKEPTPATTVYTFDAAQGSWGSSIKTMTVEGELGDPVVAPASPSYEGYEFDKWETADGMEYKEGYTMFGKDPLTFYAKYKEPTPTTTVYTFDAAQGSWNMGVRTMTVEGEPGEVVIAPTAPTLTGYVLERWETAQGIPFVQGSTTFGKDALTFYARYTFTPGWHEDENGWIYINRQGHQLVACWATIDEGRYYFDASGYRVENCWKLIDGKWYNFMPNGIVRTDWYWDALAHGWYYFDETGAMQTGWTLVRNTWHYMDGSGLMKTGWFWDTNNWSWYYLRDDGAMESGCWSWIANRWYGFYANGKMCTGWTWDDYYAGWFWCDTTSGAMQTGWLEVNGIWYYLENNGLMAVGWAWINGEWYYLTQSGAMAVGWQQVGDDWYYLSPLAPQGAMLSGWQTINGSRYYFNTSGVMVHDKMVDGHWLRSDGRGW